MATKQTPLYRWASEVLEADFRTVVVSLKQTRTIDEVVDELRDRDVEVSRETVRRVLRGGK